MNYSRKDRNNKIIVDPRGHITLGYEDKDGKLHKQFNFVLKNPSTGEVKFEELQAIYGDSPEEMLITFPSNDLDTIFKDPYGQWGSNNTRKRICNGETCKLYIEQNILGTIYKVGENECICKKHSLRESTDKEIKKLSCRCDMMLFAYILNPQTLQIVNPLCYTFGTHSTNSADNIAACLEGFLQYKGIPFMISVQKVKRIDNITYPLIHLRPYVTAESLIQHSNNVNVKMLGSSSMIQVIPEDDDEIIDEKPALPEKSISKIDTNHLSGHVARIKRTITCIEADQTLALMIKDNKLSITDKEYLQNVTNDHKDFMNGVFEKEMEESK